jgi:hypothetical protein
MKKTNLIIFASLLFSILCFGQVKNIVAPELAMTELHKANIGKIFFTEKRISNDSLSKANFLKTYKLTNKSDLFFVAYFNNSLTNYKHQLMPAF